jgi:hypothetical protein
MCLALALALAEVAADHLYRSLRQQPGGAAAIFPSSVRVDLLALALLTALVAATTWIDARQAEPQPSLRRDPVSLGLALCLTLLVGVLLGPIPAVSVPLAYALVVTLGPRLANACPADLRLALSLGLAARVLVAVGLGLYGRATHGGLPVLDDEESVHRAAVELGPILVGGFGDLQSAWWHLSGPYLTLVGALYLVFGPDFTVARILNAALGSLGIGLAFGITKRLFGQPAARAAAWTVALWPGLVLWSSTGLREALFLDLTLLVPWLFARRLPTPSRAAALGLAALTLVLIGALREYAAWILALGGALALVRRTPLLVVPLVVALVLVWPRLPIAARLTPSALEYQAAAIELSTVPETDPAKRPGPPDPSMGGIGLIVRAQLPGESDLTTAVVYGYVTDPVRYVLATDRESLYVVPRERVLPINDETVTWDVPLRRLASGLRLLFVPPPPWGSEPVQRVATLPDALAWDLLVAITAVAAWRERRFGQGAWLVTGLYLAVMIVALGVISSNLGTAVRHRSMLVPWATLLAAPSLAELMSWVQSIHVLRSRSRPAA